MSAAAGRASGDRLLDPTTVRAYLVARGLARAEETISIEELGGGVSNVVLGVELPGRRLVVKQSLPRLRVQDEWFARRERAITEAAAIELARALIPGSAPAVLDVDDTECALVIERAPVAWRTWKDLLLAGEADPAVAARVGELLGGWQRLTAAAPELTRPFADTVVFDQLRVDPYYRTVALRSADLAGAVEAVVEQMWATRLCLVHGDYSPKNVLVGETGLWVIDFEVAHVGDPVFDVAFMLNHLHLKAIHRPDAAGRLRACAFAFLRSYGESVPSSLAPEPEYLARQLGCLLVARVDGKSPAEYLTASERVTARALGRSLLVDPPASVHEAWER